MSMHSTRRNGLLNLLVLAACAAAGAAAPQTAPYALVKLQVPRTAVLPSSVDINLTDVAMALGLPTAEGRQPVCYLDEDGSRGALVPSQFDPAPGFDAHNHAIGVLTFDLPADLSGAIDVRMYLPESMPPQAARAAERSAIGVTETDDRVTVENDYYTIVHDIEKQSGLPSRFEFKHSGKTFGEFRWNDRVYHKQLNGFYLRESRQPRMEVIARGPIRAVVRLHLDYARADARPDPRPTSVYDFIYYADSPFVRVTGDCKQGEPFEWSELHFIEINFPGTDFTEFATSADPEPSDLEASEESYTGNWGALIDEPNTLGLVAPSIRIYDGRGGYGTYLHGPWVNWHGTERQFTAHLYVSATEQSLSDFRQAADSVSLTTLGTVTTPAFQGRLTRARQLATQLDDNLRRGMALWALAMIERAGHQERALHRAMPAAAQLLDALQSGQEDLLAMVADTRPDGEVLHALYNSALGIAVTETEYGALSVHSLFDPQTEREYLAAPSGGQIFCIELSGPDDESLTVSADTEWSDTELHIFEQKEIGRQPACELQWRGPTAQPDLDLRVSAAVKLDGARSVWSLRVDNPSDEWSIRNVDFPCVRLTALHQGDDRLFCPKASGVLVSSPLTKGEGFTGTYPSGWCSMQFGGYYDDAGGVYFAAHDPLASRKSVVFEDDGDALSCRFGWNPEDMSVPGNDFQHPGRCVLQVFDGDWFDAAQIYKSWVRQQAEWWPSGDQQGRPDTPRWMRDNCMWALMSGTPDNVVEPCIRLREYIGVPTAVHWYSWHQIPFDNDYPHYFPTKEGFADGVRRLQENGVRVMPYINGRLWDTDTEDFETVGFPAAAKNEDGENYIEVYGSGEKLAPMCPTTDTWQNKVQQIVLRLVGDEYNVDGVYIDQIGAASPRLCFDRSHGHPLGGGHWWCTDGYWPMLTSLQDRLPEGKMITTECNAESYCRWMDGYLSWHFQHDGQIPLFAAVYGGNVQIFSRAYRGNDKLAYRMKAAQSLVFGEQIGWLNANYVLDNQEVQGPFFRRMARLRHHLLPYLSWGEMARPPKLVGDMPNVTADWAWQPNWPVTDTAIQSGAWKSKDGKLALIFVNVTGEPLSATLEFDGTQYAFDGDSLSWRRIDENGRREASVRPSNASMPIELGPYAAFAFEVAPAD